MLRAPRIEAERKAMYDQYKSASQSAKDRLKEWESAYIDEQLAYLDSRYKDPGTTERQKLQIEQMKADLEYKKARAAQAKIPKPEKEKYTPVEGVHYLKGKSPYSELLYSLGGEPESLFPPLPKGKSYTPSMAEEKSKEIILQMYDIETDPKGYRYLTPREGQEGYLDVVRENISRQREAEPIIQELKLAQMELERMGEEGTRKREFIDRPARKKLEARIAELEEQRDQILKGTQTEELEEEKNPKLLQNIETTEEDNIWNL